MLKIALNPSKLLAVLLLAGHLILAIAIWPLQLPLWCKLILTAMLTASLVFYLRRDALLAAENSIVALEIEEDRKCNARLKSGDWEEGFLLDSSFVAPYLTILNFKLENTRFARYGVIVRDSLPADDFRRLRVWLRWKCARKKQG